MVKIDGRTYWDVVNTQAEQFDSVDIFAGDKWYAPAAGMMKNVVVKSKNE